MNPESIYHKDEILIGSSFVSQYETISTRSTKLKSGSGALTWQTGDLRFGRRVPDVPVSRVLFEGCDDSVKVGKSL